MTYPVTEHFVSINGEGQHAGELALFLRFPGCNLDCSYCDTRWANEENVTVQELTLQKILEVVEQSGVRNVTVTGGEPLLQAGIADLLLTLSDLPGIWVEVETNGSVSLAPFFERTPKVSFTMDYKLPASGMEDRMALSNLEGLRREDTLKFVCGSQEDLHRARALIEEYRLSGRVPVYLSPVFGQLEPCEIVAFMKQWGLSQVRLQLQLHKFIWPAEQRGV